VLCLRLEKEPQFRVVAQAYDGRESIDLIEKFRPDIIILDIVMPEYDGVYIVSHVRKTMIEYTPIIYILSGLGVDPVIKELSELGVDFFGRKPVPMDVVMHTLTTLVKHRGTASSADGGDKVAKKQEFSGVIWNILLHLGMSPHLTSSKCVLEALFLYPRDCGSLTALSKSIYPRIGEKYSISASSVERNIRHAITIMQKKKTGLCTEIFSYSITGHISNGEFLSVLSEYIGKVTKPDFSEKGA